MSLEVIYVTRHGFRSNWLVDPSSGNYTNFVRSPTGGAADPALTAHGVDQANELAGRLLAADPPIERVYSSLYYRCLQTIEPFVRQASSSSSSSSSSPHAPTQKNGRRHLQVRGETGLGEWYGTADFEHPVPAGVETLEGLLPGLLDRGYRAAVTPRRTGEGPEELHERVAAAAAAVVAQCDREGVRAVLLCTHAAVVIALGRVLTGNMPADVEAEDFRAFTCGLSVYRRRRLPGSSRNQATDGDNGRPLDWRGGRGVAGGWDCELDSDCSHLSSGEERGWKFSGDESFKDTVTGRSILAPGGTASSDKDAAGNTERTSRRGKL